MFSNIFNFLLKSALFYIHCCNFFYFYCIMLHSVCLLYEKKRSTTRILIHDCLFLPNLHISKKFHVPAIFTMTSQGRYMHHSNQILLKLTCAKFHASSCSQTKVKVGAPPPKNEVQKAHPEYG